MTDSPIAAVVRRLRNRLGQPLVENLPDAVLLERFVRQRDQDAFAAWCIDMARLVWRICRRVLRQTQQAEEAYQTTVLALAQQAAKIRKPSALASWLYGVAYRIARKMRANPPREQYRAASFLEKLFVMAPSGVRINRWCGSRDPGESHLGKIG